MSFFRRAAVLCFSLTAVPGMAQDLASTCHATSSYDVTLNTDNVVFDRAAPAPTRVVMEHGSLLTDGVAVRLNAENRDRVTLFERDLRALAPQVRTVAQNGVDMAVRAVRAEANGLRLQATTRAEVDQRLNARAVDLKQRLAASRSTHDWSADAINQYASQIGTDLMPLIAGDMGQQAIDAAMSGDLQTASDLRDQAANLSSEIQPRLLRRMQALRPQIQALCPSIDALSELQQGLRDSNGRPLDLLQTTR